jgi:hypothetical protein
MPAMMKSIVVVVVHHDGDDCKPASPVDQYPASSLDHAIMQ